MSPSDEKKAARKANVRLYQLCQNRFSVIPLNDILDAAKEVGVPVQEDGTPWSGILCGRGGRASIQLQGARRWLQLQWYKLESGNYEVNAYIA